MAPTLIAGPDSFAELGDATRRLGLTNVLVVADRGIRAVGYVAEALRLLSTAGVSAHTFHEFSENPTSAMVEAGRLVAVPLEIDGFIGLGGGSSIDCAKGINFVLTNGGTMADYRGYGRAVQPLVPLVAVPTTAGTGSEAQSYALVSDPVTHEKMACGDFKAMAAIAILDPVLTVSQPAGVAAAAGYDALAHSVETWVTTRRSSASDVLAEEAWRLLSANYARVLSHPGDLDARAGMLLGAHRAGAAIELSMLGATHACANALTALYGTGHGVAIGLLLRHVVGWNAEADAETAARYRDLDGDLVGVLERAAVAGGIPPGLASAGARREDMDRLVALAMSQWTGTFNPRPFDATGARTIFERAW
jgi:alcohol dehydrogenase